jgi:NADPH:quinone reductase-like Zn-dependent oxidoreductase
MRSTPPLRRFRSSSVRSFAVAKKGINYKSTPDWEKAAMEFTGGRGVDQVVEVGGAGTLTRSFGAIRVGGKISLIRGLSGPATELNPGLILARRANVLTRRGWFSKTALTNW